ncbi:MAG TPA: DUF3857 domain-containing protein [Candidatus Acidoferrum sp.]|nr:DUF3857 domain-containing protein [Candidatus Acidoferrum sp.]
MNFLLRRLAGIPFFFLLIASQPIWAQQATPCSLPRFSQNMAALQAAVTDAKIKPGSDVVILCEEDLYVFESDGRTTHTNYLSYKVLSQRGAENWDAISVRWEPWHDQKPVVRAQVFAADGSIHPLDAKVLKDETVSDSEAKIYSDGRVVRGPLPAIAAGSIVEQEEVISERLPFFQPGTVDRIYFGDNMPTLETRLTLDAPDGFKLKYETQLLPNVKAERTENAGRTRVSFVQGPMDPLEPVESNLPADIPGRPSVTFATGRDWAGIAEKYAEVVDAQIGAADLKSTAARVTKGKNTREGKAAAIQEFLSGQVRYTGVEFGESAIVPHSPEETLTHQYGDCKDKSSLLVALLRAAGVPAYVALLNAGSRQDISAELPGMGMFDHAIVYLPGEPEIWIDATDEYARLGQLPSSEQGRHALIAKKGTTGLVQTPEFSSKDNLIVEKREFLLAENGPARIVETTQPHGVYESEYRAYYADADSKDVKKNLTDYIADVYLADNLVRTERSNPKDLSKQFELQIEAGKAKRGETDLESAAAAIRLEGLFNRLPTEMQEREKQKKKEGGDQDAADPPKKPRTQDYLLPSAFINEWKYKIVPPPGFQAKGLPANRKLQLGPAIYEQEFSLSKERVVEGSIRFDTVKRRFTVAEVEAIRSGVVQLREQEPILIEFELEAEALRRQGKMRESLQSTRALIALHPKEGLHHLQVAKGLLDAGLGNGAREEARLAVKLEPNSSLAEETLAEILEYDIVGRKMRPGSDYVGAEEAFRAAIKLDPEKKAAIANLAILLEYNRWGLRYGPGSKLREAVTEYRKLTKLELAGYGLQNNITFALFYSAEFADAQKEAQILNPAPNALLIACAAALRGPAAALSEAQKKASNEAQRKDLLKNAGNMLANLRKYELAAELLEAGAGGDTASDVAADALIFKKTREHEQLVLGNDPSGIALNLILLESRVDLTAQELRKICSRNGIPTLASEESIKEIVKSQQRVYSWKSRSGTFPEVGIDLSLARALPKVDGSDATGYKVILWGSATYKKSIYVVKEGAEYKVLATSKSTVGAALEILDRVNAGDLTGARVLLDWLREDEHLAIDDDPLSGGMFPRLWTKGKTADAPTMKLAAATLLCSRKDTAKLALGVLRSSQIATPSEMEKQGILLATQTAYAWLLDSRMAAEIAGQIYQQYPDSKRAFINFVYHLSMAGKFDEAERVARERINHFPNEPDGLRRRAFIAVDRGDYQAAHDLGKQLVESGKGDAWDMNNLVWQGLYTGKISSSDLEYAVRAAELSNKASGILHTLGCAYAELGKTKEARDVLLQAMDKLNFDEPDDNYWYAFGRIAEQYGEQKIAAEDYHKVEKPEYDSQIPSSAYKLAQMRLAAMEKSH